MLSIIVLACYLASAAWLGSSVYRADGHAARGRRVTGLTLGALAVITHAVLLWQALFARPTLAFSVGETASLIGLPIGLIALIASWRNPRFAGIGAILMTLAGVVAATTDEGARNFALKQHNWEIGAHIILSTTAYALLTIAAALAIALWLLERRLRSRQPLGLLAASRLDALMMWRGMWLSVAYVTGRSVEFSEGMQVAASVIRDGLCTAAQVLVIVAIVRWWWQEGRELPSFTRLRAAFALVGQRHLLPHD